MKNYIIFYAAIIAFVIGGIQWTSHVMEVRKQEELSKIDFHKQMTAILAKGGEVSPSETNNKNIVLSLGLISDETKKSDLQAINALSIKYKGNTVFYDLSSKEEYTSSQLKKLNITPAFKVIYKPWLEVYKYITSLTHYFYTRDELDKNRVRTPYIIVISNTGEIKLYKTGYDKDYTKQIESAIK